MVTQPTKDLSGVIKRCATCQFFRDGECRKSPPSRLPRKFDSTATAGNRVRDEELIWGWPSVSPDDWCGDYALSLVQPTAEGGRVPVGWRCFHCDEVFTDEHVARLHFGRDEGSVPACQIKGSEGAKAHLEDLGLASAPAAPPAGQARVKVKPLEWARGADPATWRAPSVFGDYAYWEIDDNEYVLFPGEASGRKVLDARLRAQAHHDEKLLSALDLGASQ